MLDTRRRGGGVSTDYEDGEVIRLQPEADSYWDVISNVAFTYQKGGFIILRLPSGLRDDFTEEELTRVIDRNIAAGVRYKIEDLEGNRWTQ